jgi:TRAP-type C4-dicarboxylate transport system permease small subunit
VDSFLYFSGALLMAVILITVGMEVAFRYLLRNPLPWTSELATIALVWLVFISGSYGFAQKSHIKIDVVVRILPEPFHKILPYLLSIIFLILFTALITVGTQYALVIAKAKTSALRVSQIVYYLAVPVSAAFMLFYTVLEVIGLIKGWAKEPFRTGDKG